MAVRFDNVADHLLITSSVPSFDADYTFACWLYLTAKQSASAYATIFSLNLNLPSGNWDILELFGNSGSDTRLILETENPYVQTNGSTSLATATWYHVALIRSGNAIRKGYLNGVQEFSDTNNLSGRGSPTRMELGEFTSGNTGAVLNARIAGVKFWSAALTVAELQQEMYTLRPQRFANLYGFWPTFPGTGERNLDYSGLGANWTEVGTLTDEDPPPVAWGSQYWSVPKAAGGSIAYTLTCAQASYTLTGEATGLKVGHTVAAAQGSYTLTGEADGLKIGHTVTATQGVYTLTGEATAFHLAWHMAALQGSYTLTGEPAAFKVGHTVAPAQGAHALNGQAAGLKVGHILAAVRGLYTLTGEDATLSSSSAAHYTLSATQGAYALTGEAAAFKVSHTLVSAFGAYTLTGEAVGLSRGHRTPAAQGSYALTGAAAAFERMIRLAAAHGSYALNGQDVDLVGPVFIVGTVSIAASAAGPSIGASARAPSVSASAGSPSITASGEPV